MTDEKPAFLKHIGLTSLTTLGIGIGAFVASKYGYRTARTNELLVRTRWLSTNIEVKKKCIEIPFHNIKTISTFPRTCNLRMNVVSKENVRFDCPVVLILRPKNDIKSLENYANNILNYTPNNLKDIIMTIIEDETRAHASNTSIEEIFSGRTGFRNAVIGNIQARLDGFGLEIFNARLDYSRDCNNLSYDLNEKTDIDTRVFS